MPDNDGFPGSFTDHGQNKVTDVTAVTEADEVGFSCTVADAVDRRDLHTVECRAPRSCNYYQVLQQIAAKFGHPASEYTLIWTETGKEVWLSDRVRQDALLMAIRSKTQRKPTNSASSSTSPKSAPTSAKSAPTSQKDAVNPAK